MKKLLTIIFFLIFNLIYSQSDRMSEHKISFNINEKQKEILSSNIYIVIENDTINGKNINDKYYFPFIEKEFSIVVKINKIEFKTGLLEPTVLNSDCDIDFGIISNLKKMTSVAEYNGMNKSDKGWEWYSKRYFIVDKTHTIDIENAEKIKILHYLVLNGISKSSEKTIGTNIVVQRIVKSKK